MQPGKRANPGAFHHMLQTTVQATKITLTSLKIIHRSRSRPITRESSRKTHQSRSIANSLLAPSDHPIFEFYITAENEFSVSKKGSKINIMSCMSIMPLQESGSQSKKVAMDHRRFNPHFSLVCWHGSLSAENDPTNLLRCYRVTCFLLMRFF